MHFTSSSHFGQVLRRFRNGAGLTQEELAERAGLSTRGVSDLERGIHASPRPETVRLLADALALEAEQRTSLLAAAHSELAAPAEPETSHPPPNHGLLPELIGRDDDVAHLRGLLRHDDVRLVTLTGTGTGGVGKTRLALAAAGALADDERFPNGAVVVELAPVHDAKFVASAIAAALGVRARGEQPLIDSLKAALQSRRLLLVLDNFEQILSGAPLVGELLVTCPGLSVLATSRERLHLRSERVVAVEPLSLPPTSSPTTPVSFARLTDAPAIRLFVERAQEAQPRFALTADNASVIAEICRRVDCLPLAIELAAARIKVLSPAFLCARLAHSLPLLTGGGRDLPEHQQSMRSTIAWSYDLLSHTERRFFRYLAVFMGSFTLDAFEEVCGHLASPALDTIAALTSLVDKSLVRTVDTPDGAPRDLMLETIREFAEEQLAASGEEDEARQRHVGWCLGFAGDAPTVMGPFIQAAEILRLETELANFRAALNWLETSHNTSSLMKLVTRLGYFLYLAGHEPEALDWHRRVLSNVSDETPPEYIKTLIQAGHLAQTLGVPIAREYLDKGRLLAQASGDVARQSHATILLGILAEDNGDYEEAEALMTMGRELAEQAELEWAPICADYHLGIIAYGRGELRRARMKLEAARTAALAAGDILIMTWNLPYLALIAWKEDDVPEAANFLHQAQQIDREFGLRRGDFTFLGAAAVIASSLHELPSVAQLLGAATAEFHDVPFALPEGTDFTHAEELALQQMGPTAFSKEWGDGHQMRREEIAAEIEHMLRIAEESLIDQAIEKDHSALTS
ncbi:MAG: helix-turn-helix domain-containing protein [Thermomicrobiales bacterium]